MSRARSARRAGPVAAALAGAALAWVAPAAAEDPVGALLESLAPGLAPAPRVEVTGRVEREAGDAALVVAVTPAPGTRLVADPGIAVTLAGRAPAALVVPGQDYLPAPAEIRVPLVGSDADHAWPVRVEYAYCVVERQCLFGEAALVVAPTGTTRVCAAGTTPVAC